MASIFKYNEDRHFQDVINYIKTTYTQHYVTGDNSVQLMDLIDGDPQELEIFSKWSAMKYLSRFGKKDGKNVKDLYKTIHYVLLMIRAIEMQNGTQKPYIAPQIDADETAYRKAVNDIQSTVVSVPKTTFSPPIVEEALNDEVIPSPPEVIPEGFVNDEWIVLPETEGK